MAPATNQNFTIFLNIKWQLFWTGLPAVRLFVARSCELFGFRKVSGHLEYDIYESPILLTYKWIWNSFWIYLTKCYICQLPLVDDRDKIWFTGFFSFPKQL